MPVLQWIGKEKVINHHLDVPYRVLERKYSYDENGQHEEDNGTKNMVIHGDNLEALKSLLPQYEGLIKCIYIDPPYNTAKSSEANKQWIYSDNVDDPKIKEWLDKVVGDEGEDLSRHDKWLCMMYIKLVSVVNGIDFYYVFTTIDVCVLHCFATICIFTYIFIEEGKCHGDHAKSSKTTRYLSNYEGEIYMIKILFICHGSV